MQTKSRVRYPTPSFPHRVQFSLHFSNHSLHFSHLALRGYRVVLTLLYYILLPIRHLPVGKLHALKSPRSAAFSVSAHVRRYRSATTSTDRQTDRQTDGRTDMHTCTRANEGEPKDEGIMNHYHTTAHILLLVFLIREVVASVFVPP